MKQPRNLSFFFIAITAGRVALYISQGLHVGPAGWLFSIGIAWAVFESFRWISYSDTDKSGNQTANWHVRAPAIASGLFFIVIDLIFNEGEIVRSLAPQDLVPPESNFIGFERDAIRAAMQVSALLFGAVPTLAVALLGWLQGAIDGNVPIPATWHSRIARAIGQAGAKLADKVASQFELVLATRFGLQVGAKKESRGSGNSADDVTPKKWAELNAEDIKYIESHSRGQVAYKFAVSDGSAGNWKRDVRDGIMPWSSKLPQLPG